MRYVEVAPVKIVRAGSDVFTYATSNTAITPGQIVTIPVGTKTATGVVMREVPKPPYATKEVIEVIEETPLPAALLQTLAWIAHYYRSPLAQVLQTALPRGITVTRRAVKTAHPNEKIRQRTQIVFTEEQRSAIDTILAQPAGTTLLQGVTGSGKTEVYKEVARQCLAEDKSVILLVPEISLTSQLVDEFYDEFPDALVTHSHMTEAQRHHAWRTALTRQQPSLVIGPRSALFLPVSRLGAIIVDEAHEPSYKQEQTPRYSALRVASVLGMHAKARVVFGSATPLIAEKYLAHESGAQVAVMTQRAVTGATPPKITVIDMKNREATASHPFLSLALRKEIEQNLARGQQTLLFHNRRGSATTTLCESCGWTALCPRCFVPLILHADSFSLSCHICSHSEKVPTSCPSCQAADILHKGIGTKRIETELQKLYPRARIARFDADTLAAETVSARYKELYDGDIDILIGTQVIAKGLDLPNLATVGVIQADSGLALPDYMATERTFQLLAQVIGRVGRTARDSSVIIQSYQPTHPAIAQALTQDYDSFYRDTLEARKIALFPPFRHLLQLTAVYKTEAGAIRAAKELRAVLAAEVHADVTILGPAPAFYERVHGTYRWQLLLKSPSRQHLIAALAHVPASHWQTELDPASLL